METQLDELGLYGIYDVWHTPWWQTQIFYISCLIVATFLSLISLFFLMKRLWRKKTKLPFWQQAISELEGIKQSKYATATRGKEFYFMVTGILKKYLAVRYQLNTAGKTDSQLVECLQKAEFPAELIKEVETIFMGGLTIKFANAQAAQERIEQDLAGSIALIKRTIPQEKSN